MTQKENSETNLDRMFHKIELLTETILQKNSNALLICGRGGIGKTYTIRKTLADNKLVESVDYVMYTGDATPKALYETFYENNGKIIVFDDCDAFLKDKKAINILKGALDTGDKRIISWLISSKSGNLPTSFEFNGRVIFISNLALEEIDSNLRTRITLYELKLSNIDVLRRMGSLWETICKERNIDYTVFTDCYLILCNLRERYEEKNKLLSMRDLIKIINIRKSIFDDIWKEIAIDTLLTELSN